LKAALLIIIIAIIFGISLLIKSFFKNNFTNIAVTALCSFVIILLIINPQVCMKDALQGAILFFYKVFPTTFPFLVIANIIIYYDGVYIYSKLFGRFLCKPLRLSDNCSIALIVSMLCGYPLGAKYSCDLYESKEIDYETFLRLINIASNCSPLFIIGTLGASMLNSAMCGYILLAASYTSCFVMSLILPCKAVPKSGEYKPNKIYTKRNLGEVFKNSIENAVESCVYTVIAELE
jgi:sporulation integral membrane protein YlbJ